MIPVPILIQMGLVSAVVQYVMDKYTDNYEPEVEGTVNEVDIQNQQNTQNTQNQQSPVEGQSLLGKTCIENRRRILSLMEEQKKLVPGDEHKLLKDKHKLLKEECTTNKDSILNLTSDLERKNNVLVDSIAAVDAKADSIYGTNAHRVRLVKERTKNHHRIMETHIKNTLDRTKFAHGDDSLTTKDIEKELTIMEELLGEMEKKKETKHPPPIHK